MHRYDSSQATLNHSEMGIELEMSGRSEAISESNNYTDYASSDTERYNSVSSGTSRRLLVQN